MKVKILTILAGPALSAQPGDVLDLDLPTARVLIDGGYAVMDAVDAGRKSTDEHGRDTDIESAATAAPGQRATSPRQRARPGK